MNFYIIIISKSLLISLILLHIFNYEQIKKSLHV